jgi:CBS domain-containing protein
MKARDVMTPNPDVVTPDEPVTRAAQVMRDRNVGIVPVVEDRSTMKLRGVITDRDIAIRHVASGHDKNCRVGDELSEERLSTVRPDADVKDVMEVMKREQVRRVPVIEGDNRLVGIIAQADIAERGPSEKEVGQVVEKISQPSGKSGLH